MTTEAFPHGGVQRQGPVVALCVLCFDEAPGDISHDDLDVWVGNEPADGMWTIRQGADTIAIPVSMFEETMRRILAAGVILGAHDG